MKVVFVDKGVYSNRIDKYKKIFENKGIKTELFSDTESFIDKFPFSYDYHFAVISNNLNNGMSGADLVEKIRTTDLIIPICFLTDWSEDEKARTKVSACVNAIYDRWDSFPVRDFLKDKAITYLRKKQHVDTLAKLLHPPQGIFSGLQEEDKKILSLFYNMGYVSSKGNVLTDDGIAYLDKITADTKAFEKLRAVFLEPTHEYSQTNSKQ